MRLDEYLFINKIKQVDFAKKCGITQSCLWSIMNFRYKIKIDMAHKIHHLTGGQVTYTDWLEKNRPRCRSAELMPGAEEVKEKPDDYKDDQDNGLKVGILPEAAAHLCENVAHGATVTEAAQ